MNSMLIQMYQYIWIKTGGLNTWPMGRSNLWHCGLGLAGGGAALQGQIPVWEAWRGQHQASEAQSWHTGAGGNSARVSGANPHMLGLEGAVLGPWGPISEHKGGARLPEPNRSAWGLCQAPGPSLRGKERVVLDLGPILGAPDLVKSTDWTWATCLPPRAKSLITTGLKLWKQFYCKEYNSKLGNQWEQMLLI